MSRKPLTADDAIRQTDDDAALSRLSSVNRGLLPDPFAASFAGHNGAEPISSASQAGPSRPIANPQKPVVIDVGTHHRTWAVDKLVDSFMRTATASRGKQKATSTENHGVQVVSLGAGSDTRFFRLMSQKHPPQSMRYVEIDFPAVVQAKADLIRSDPRLATLAGLSPEHKVAAEAPHTHPQADISCLHTENLTLLPLDLRLDASAALSTHLGFLDPTIPTIFIAECALCYMTLEQSAEVILWFTSRFERCVGVVYEMFGLDDQFGRVMLGHMRSRKLTLPGVMPSLAAWQSRLISSGFSSSAAASLWDIRRKHVSRKELERVSRLAQLDEVEELKLILEHYCVAWGYKGFDEAIGLGRGEAVPPWWDFARDTP